jgi:hypothetical protein
MSKSMLDLQNNGKQVTSLNNTDLLLAATDPAGTPDDAVIQWSDIKALLYNGGWIEVSDTWSYATSSTIVVPSDATLYYKKGWGVRFKQGGAYKYMYMTTVAATLLTLTGGIDYSVANSTITDVAVAPNPATAIGFPTYFNHTTTLFGSAGSAGTYSENVFLEGAFSISGGRVFFESSKMVVDKGSWAGVVNITLPVAANFAYVNVFQHPPAWWGNGANASEPKAVVRLVNSTAATFLDYINSSFFEWTDVAANDFMILKMDYFMG